jgi:hypothetical protein
MPALDGDHNDSEAGVRALRERIEGSRSEVGRPGDQLGIEDPPCRAPGPAVRADALLEPVVCVSSVAAQLASRLNASDDLEPGSAV